MPLHVRLHPRPLSLLIVALLNQTAFAEERKSDEEEDRLDPVLVTATRGNDTNTVVRDNRIDVEQANSLRDLFRQTPEVNVAGGAPVAQKLYVRGINERMLAVTIDGASQPESAYHHTGQVMVEPELLKRIEIEAGTGAATAGPGALAGALRFTTKNADDLLQDDRRIGALFKTNYSDNTDGTKLTGAVFGRIGNGLGLLASATRHDGDDYEDGRGRAVENSAADARNAFVKLNGGSGAHVFDFAYEENEDEGLRNKRTNLGPAPFNPTERQRTARESTTLNYGYAPGDPRIDVHAVAYANDNSIDLAIGQPLEERDGTRTHGVNVSNYSEVSAHALTYGIDYRRDVGYSDVPGLVLADDRARVIGIFVQDDVALSDRWLLGIGARYDVYDYTDGVGRTFDSSGVSPSASLSFLATDALRLHVTHARALRGVGIVEPFLRAHQENDADIDPERARNTEVGAEWQRDGWRVIGNAFRQRIDDFIGYDDFRDNMGDVRVEGYNASAGYQADVWSLSLGVAHAKPDMDGDALTDDNALLLGNATGRTWVAQFDYALPSPDLTFGWTGRWVEALTFVPEGARTKPGYAAHDVYVQWSPLASDALHVTLSVKNVFDRHYYDQGSFGFHPRWGDVAGLPEPGRDVRIGLAYRF